MFLNLGKKSEVLTVCSLFFPFMIPVLLYTERLLSFPFKRFVFTEKALFLSKYHSLLPRNINKKTFPLYPLYPFSFVSALCCYKLTESLRLEETFKISKSNHLPSTTRPPLNYVPKHHNNYTAFKYLQDY